VAEQDQWEAALERIAQQRQALEDLAAWKLAQRQAESAWQAAQRQATKRWRQMQDIEDLMRR